MLRSMCQSILSNSWSTLDTVMRIPQNVSCISVRFRYFKDKPMLQRRWGYKDKLAWRGLLPRLETRSRIPKPMYTPSSPWTEKRAHFGQNDYIDILGDPKIHPVMISYNVPAWLRGFYGNEFQTLIRRRQFFGPKIRAVSSVGFGHLNKNIKYQYKFLNKHQPQDRMPRAYREYWKNK